MDRQNFVIIVILAVFITSVQNLGVFLNFVPPQIYLRYFGQGGGPLFGEERLLIAIW